MTLSLLATMATPDNPTGGLTVLLLQIGAIGLVFYFLILRPQSQARKKHDELLKAIKKGDEVTTAGGIIGKVKDVKEDRVTIESAGSSLVIERSRIIRVGDSPPSGTAP